MNLKNCQQIIIDFIDINYQNYLKDYDIKKPFIILDFLDFDKYKYDFSCFVDFNRITFSNSRYKDDCSGTMQFSISIFLVHRNDTSENIKEKMLNAVSAFYELLEYNDIKNVANKNITEINNYNIVEGTKYIAVSEVSINLEVEITK
jgi:hypothetical protein